MAHLFAIKKKKDTRVWNWWEIRKEEWNFEVENEKAEPFSIRIRQYKLAKEERQQQTIKNPKLLALQANIQQNKVKQFVPAKQTESTKQIDVPNFPPIETRKTAKTLSDSKRERSFSARHQTSVIREDTSKHFKEGKQSSNDVPSFARMNSFGSFSKISRSPSRITLGSRGTMRTQSSESISRSEDNLTLIDSEVEAANSSTVQLNVDNIRKLMSGLQKEYDGIEENNNWKKILQELCSIESSESPTISSPSDSANI